MIVNTTAIVLKTFPYGETSLISRCFTKEKGKVSFIIRGAQSKKNLTAPYFQPLSHIQIIYNTLLLCNNSKNNSDSYINGLNKLLEPVNITIKKWIDENLVL